MKVLPASVPISLKVYESVWLLPVRIILSAVYLVIIKTRNILYDKKIFKTHRLATPIISVGNLSVGGSGKTIVVQALIKLLEEQGVRIAMLSRGYGRQSRGPLLVSDGKKLLETVQQAGDEPYMTAVNFPETPVMVAEDRYLGAQMLEARFHPDVILLDDGFQHRRLGRNLDILLIDFPPDQTAHLLPWGRLREPLSQQERADVILYSKAGIVSSNQKNTVHLVTSDHVIGSGNRQLDLARINGRIGAFAGIANPQSFFDTLEEQTGGLATRLVFRDHQDYGSRELEQIAALDCDIRITTQKDFIKLKPEFILQQQIYYLGVNAQLPEAVIQALKSYFK